MIKHLLSIAAISLLTAAASAQCVPDAQYANAGPGIWPDSTENLPCAYADDANGYDTKIDLKTATDTSVTIEFGGNPITVDAYIEAFRINSVEGLPSGFTYIPDQTVWTNGGSAPNFTSIQGCVQIVAAQSTLQGIISNSPAGQDFPIVVVVDAKINSTNNTLVNTIVEDKWLSELSSIPGITAINYDSYVLKVRPTDDGSGCQTLSIGSPKLSNSFAVQGNFPNPFNNSTEIRFTSPGKKEIRLEIRDMVGKSVLTKTILSQTGANSITVKSDKLIPGIYFYTITDGKSTFSIKMVVSGN
ncbi:MAG: T9SS type A sorting domain-containing protein [Bacteroidetes bacterium]|nr:T9SS type A sorting domain-containing protein [Bacteroidota bacterium]